MSLNTIANQLNMPVSLLRQESVKHFLEKKLLAVKSELTSLANKYQIKSIKEMDNKIKQGVIHETEESRDDFFDFDRLENKRDKLQKLIKSV